MTKLRYPKPFNDRIRADVDDDDEIVDWEASYLGHKGEGEE